MMPRLQQWIRYALVAGLFLGIGVLLSDALASHRGSGEVRIVAQRHADGNVAVALQERQLGGEWGERLHPRARLLPADAPPGAWLSSSPLDVGAGTYQDGALVCIVDHGTPADRFWRDVHASARHVGEDLRMNLRVVSGPTPAEQAAAIDQCVADGALVISTTLAAPGVVGDAVRRARSQGVQVTSFNSGIDWAPRVGAAPHVSLEDRAAGRLAGRAFADAGVDGLLLCVIHEADNVGLEERCDQAAEGYGGELERLEVHSAGLADPEGMQALIEVRLEMGDVAAVLTLNDQLIDPALAAIASSGDEIQLGSFGYDFRYALMIRDGRLLFTIYDQPHLQAYLALAVASSLGFLANQEGSDATGFYTGVEIVIQPQLFDRALIERILQGLESHANQPAGGDSLDEANAGP